MYQPPHFREERTEVQHALMRAHPLALLVTFGEGGLTANPVPLILHPERGEKGVLRGHLARANPQWRSFDPSVECLAVFQGADAYITPSWYATKRETGKVVPTWNYATVHAWGRPVVIDDEAWLRRQLDDLTALREGVRPQPWKVDDAPADFVRAQVKGIIGVEIAISRIEGKWKVSQNRPEADRTGVAEGLAHDEPAMSELVRRYGRV
jgi:transcriptional regulator